jgi:hypothetical protein
MGARKHCHFHHPRTTQERRWNEAHRKYVRGRRSPKVLPNAWDDGYKSRISSKSWKDKYKKRKQWMKVWFKEGWLYRFGDKIPYCTDWKPWPCPGCPICHTRKWSTYKKKIKGRKKG